MDKARGFEVMLAADEEEDLQDTLSTHIEDVIKRLSDINAEKARATHESD